MPKIAYINKRFAKKSELMIAIANQIINEYSEQGFDLTLRQLYYQMVARDYIPNNVKSYKRLGSVINDARLAGLIDWYAITDRTRNLRKNTHWESPQEIIEASAKSYLIDKWETQTYRPEVWIEKDALIGVIAKVCRSQDTPFFSCRGYTSQSEMWRAGQRLLNHIKGGQIPFIIHLGDHDPSGIDMSRDLIERFEMFIGGKEGVAFHFLRIALNYDQITRYNPPPNPAKLSDSRANGYIAKYGRNSWELDALEPTVIAKLIEDEITGLRDEQLWKDAVNVENEQKRILNLIHENLDEIVATLEED